MQKLNEEREKIRKLFENKYYWHTYATEIKEGEIGEQSHN